MKRAETRFVPLAGLLIFIVLATSSRQAVAQTFPSHEVDMTIDSGDLRNAGMSPAIVWRKVLRVDGAEWLRLNFDRIVLAHDVVANTSSTLRIVSLKDGAVQTLDARSAVQWQNTSAYFNGNAVRLELVAWPNGRLNRVIVGSMVAGEIPVILPPETICDVVDDRQLSTDVRVGRTAPGGCTAWLFNDRTNCMLTAGHCASSTSVIQFNVPLSNPNGTYNHPGPEDQYPVDPASKQFVNDTIGNDWCYFGCFENSNTGLAAFEAQGDSFQLVLPQPVSQGDQIRITGHGTVSSPVNPALNGAQKTHVGPHFSFSGSTLGYRTDTTGGNSGSPVIHENQGTAIGIHTHGGCSSGGGGNNSGTGANNPGFMMALANPLGVCRSTLEFDFPNGRPAVIAPTGGTTMRVVVSDGGETPQPGTGILHVDSGSGFQPLPMTQISANVYDAVFPPVPCGSVARFYVSAENDFGELFNNPVDAPGSFYTTLGAVELQTIFLDNFETNLGWSVSGNATDGQWERGVPAGGGDRGDPPADGDGSGSCYVTDNADGNSDVDGGSTILTSPILDAGVSGGDDAIISYYRWYSNSTGSAPMEDVFKVEISNNGGASWVNLETVGPGGSDVSGGWFQKSFRIADFLPPTSQVRLRFTASDLGGGSVVEAGVDGIEVIRVVCETLVVPEARKLLDGFVSGGQLSNVASSDDVYFELDPSPTTNPQKQKIDMIVQQTSPLAAPASLALRLEAKMTGGPSGDVIQTMELFNYNTSKFDILDLRPAANSDTVFEIGASGNLSRFVQPGTKELTARVTWSSPVFTGTPFFWSVDIDQLVWLID